MIKKLFKNNKRTSDHDYVLREYAKRPWAWKLFVLDEEGSLFVEKEDVFLLDSDEKLMLEPVIPEKISKIGIPENVRCYGPNKPGAVYFDTFFLPPRVNHIGVTQCDHGRYVHKRITPHPEPYHDVFVYLYGGERDDIVDEFVDKNHSGEYYADIVKSLPHKIDSLIDMVGEVTFAEEMLKRGWIPPVKRNSPH